MGLFDGIFGGITGAIGNVVSAKMNNKAQLKSMREQMAWQEKMNAQQQEWQESMWNKTNEYNSPVNQMDRLMEAGVNPNNAAGLVSGSTSQAQMAAQPDIPSAPSGVGSPGYDLVGGFATGQLLNAQKENIEADTEKKKEETEGQNMSNSVFLATWNMDMALKASQVNLTKEQKNAVQYQVDILFPQEKEKNEEEINNLTGAGIKLAKEIGLLQKEYKIKDQEYQNAKAQEGLIGAQAAAAKASADASEAQAEHSRQLAKHQEYQNEVSRVKSEIANEYGVDISDMDAVDQINLELYHAGATEKQQEDFWEAVNGDWSSQFKHSIKRNVVDNPGGVVNGATNVYRNVRGVRGVGNRVGSSRIGNNSNSSIVNPRSRRSRR